MGARIRAPIFMFTKDLKLIALPHILYINRTYYYEYKSNQARWNQGVVQIQ